MGPQALLLPFSQSLIFHCAAATEKVKPSEALSLPFSHLLPRPVPQIRGRCWKGVVHVVVPAVDAGPVLIEEVIAIPKGMTLDALEAAVHAVEHRLIVEGTGRALAACEEREALAK
jgi:hypothetical protein